MKIEKIIATIFVICGSLCAEVTEVTARATAYHKTHKDSDSDTKAGRTATRISLRDNCDRTIGMVAVDPKRIPYGSLVFSPGNGRFYLACDVGDAVIDRDAAKETARKHNLPERFHDALVLDFYSRKEILEDDYANFIIVEYGGEIPFRKLFEEYQEKRLEPSYWLARVDSLLEKKITPKKKELREIRDLLEEMEKNLG